MLMTKKHEQSCGACGGGGETSAAAAAVVVTASPPSVVLEFWHQAHQHHHKSQILRHGTSSSSCQHNNNNNNNTHNHLIADASVCSTNECPSATLPLEETAIDATTTTKKSVHFEERYNVEHVIPSPLPEDASKLWYSKEDYDVFSKGHTFVTQAILHAEASKDRSYSRVLERLFLQNCCCAHHFGDKTPQEEQQQPCPLVLRVMHKWPTRVGLERFVSRAMVHNVRQRRYQLLELIYTWPQTAKMGSIDTMAEQLREACERVTRPCRLFAHVVAHAAAAAAQSA